MSEGYAVAGLEDMELEPGAQAERWSAIRRHFGIQSFGVNARTATDVGQVVVPEHHEDGGQEELYVVLSGKATFTLDGEEVAGPSGTLVFVRDSAVTRKAVADEVGTTVLALGAKVGEPFTALEWELSAPAMGFFESGEHDKAVEVLSKVLEKHPDEPIVLYNLACAESMSGRKEDAIRHLGLSVSADQSDRFRELARTDTDFDPIRGEPAFAEIVG